LNNIPLIKNIEVTEVFNNYPGTIRHKLLFLRQLILDVASETDGVNNIEETLKWGEPSYVSKAGSPIRIGWRESAPTQYKLLFHCQTTLVDTFKEIYADAFEFEANRAIIFAEDDEIPIEELTHCISLALTYHNKKHLPMLGA